MTYRIRDPHGIIIGTFKDRTMAFQEFRGGVDSWLREMVKGRHMVLEEDGKTVARAYIRAKIVKEVK